jgi:low affinity Fe/Cu permease
MEQVFSRAAQWVSVKCGKAYTFAAAVFVVLAWALSGPVFSWSEGWQMVINTGTTIVTFLLVFILQHTQTHDTTAIQLKLDELIRANASADNSLRRLEDKTETEVAEVQAQQP